MHILIAPDKFKDALDAPGVAAAMAAGVRDAIPGAEVTCCPLGDGGEGTGRLLAAARGMQSQAVGVLDPLGRPRQATWWLDTAGDAGIVEMAEASGLWLLAPQERDAIRTSSFGTGQLLRAAIGAGARALTLCVGGSATVDGGAGCLQALGWRILWRGEEVPLACGGALDRVVAIEPPADVDVLRGVRLTILCDVNNPLLGPCGAAAVFAPQKGATPAQVATLQANLCHWADVLERATGVAVRDLPGAGAAGGLPAGLAAATGARLVGGFDEVARQVRLREHIRGADLVLTGEGCLDPQTAGGKVVAGVAALAARESSRPVLALVGAWRGAAHATRREAAARLGLREIIVITPPGTPLEVALAQTECHLRVAARRAVRRYALS